MTKANGVNVIPATANGIDPSRTAKRKGVLAVCVLGLGIACLVVEGVLDGGRARDGSCTGIGTGQLVLAALAVAAGSGVLVWFLRQRFLNISTWARAAFGSLAAGLSFAGLFGVAYALWALLWCGYTF